MKHLDTYELYEKAMGDCYQAGGRLIMNFFGDENHKLVHGMVNGQGSLEGMRYGHCWVESKDTVLDHSNGKKIEIPTRVYYALGGVDPKECKYYTPKESAKWMSEKEHWGPWEMSGDPVKLNEDIPDEDKEIGKKKTKIKNKDMKNIQSFESFVNEAAYKVPASDFGKSMWKYYQVNGEKTWRVHCEYAIDQVKGDNDPEERDVVFFEAMPINNDIYIKIGGINNLKKSNASTYGKNFATTPEEFGEDPESVSSEAAKFLTDKDHLKWINKNAKSEGQKIKFAMKDDYTEVIKTLVNKALGQ